MKSSRRPLLLILAVALPLTLFVAARQAASWRPVKIAQLQPFVSGPFHGETVVLLADQKYVLCNRENNFGQHFIWIDRRSGAQTRPDAQTQDEQTRRDFSNFGFEFGLEENFWWTVRETSTGKESVLDIRQLADFKRKQTLHAPKLKATKKSYRVSVQSDTVTLQSEWERLIWQRSTGHLVARTQTPAKVKAANRRPFYHISGAITFPGAAPLPVSQTVARTLAPDGDTRFFLQRDGALFRQRAR